MVTNSDSEIISRFHKSAKYDKSAKGLHKNRYSSVQFQLAEQKYTIHIRQKPPTVAYAVSMHRNHGTLILSIFIIFTMLDRAAGL